MQPKEVLPSSYVAAQYLEKNFGKVRYWFLGEEGIRVELEGAGHILVGAKDVEWIVVGMDRELTYGKLAQALRALLRKARLLTSGEGAALPTPEGPVPGADAVAGSLRGMGSLLRLWWANPHPSPFPWL